MASGTGGGKIRIPMGTGIVGDCIATGKSINIPDAYRDSRFNPDIDKKTGFVTRQILCVPEYRISTYTQVYNYKNFKKQKTNLLYDYICLHMLLSSVTYTYK